MKKDRKVLKIFKPSIHNVVSTGTNFAKNDFLVRYGL